jgi:SWI/SNF-related matrix-associated actin-dependent regulator of chromatin subfamily A member 5
LGKTLQTLSLLGYLKKFRNIDGPHLLVVPKSTLQNWANETRRWVPSLNAFIFHGDKETRARLIHERLKPINFDVCITSYEMCLSERSALRKIHWEYLVIDEAHRIKNEASKLAIIVREFKSNGRLLITGTPLQNNLHELWALLNFLLPDIFSSADDFDEWFRGHSGQAQDEMVTHLRRLLQPFLLRRLKADVEHTLKPKKELNLYVGLSEMQRNWYRRILDRDLPAINGMVGGGREGKTRLLNIVMQLRKCCNHPYLFDGAEPGPPFTTDEHLVENSGKMVVLDKLLARLKANGSRVLLFSQMSRVLDILEDYCTFRGYTYCRIDGQTPHEERIAAIDEYNRPGSDKFIFLLTTRAGGLGINLATADIVVLYDSDWNPQVDLQAQDRAHRIGQTKQVCVFRMVTEHTVEEKVIEKALQKLRLDQLVIQQGKLTNVNKPLSGEEMLTMIRHGAEQILTNKSANESSISADIEELLRRGEERTKELQSKYQNVGYDDLQKFAIEAPQLTFVSSGTPADEDSGLLFLQPGKRERKSNYHVDTYFREALRIHPQRAKPVKAPLPKDHIVIHDFQFYPPKLQELVDRDVLAHQKAHEYRIPEGADETAEEREKREKDQKAINNSKPLTEEEEKEKEELTGQGFRDWHRRDYLAFLRAIERHGRDAHLHVDLPEKTAAEIAAYAKVFWSNLERLSDYEKIEGYLETHEVKRRRDIEIQTCLNRKLARHRKNHTPLHITYFGGKGKQYTEEEDAFLLETLADIGVATPDAMEQLRSRILAAPQFRFDWFIKTRTTTDLARRCHKLVTFVEREQRESEERSEPVKSRSRSVWAKDGKRKASSDSVNAGDVSKRRK